MISLDNFPRIKMERSWEDDQEFPDTPQMLKMLKFYELACERAATLSLLAVCEAHCPGGRFDADKITKQAVHWQTTKRVMYATINLMSADPDMSLTECLYDPFVK